MTKLESIEECVKFHISLADGPCGCSICYLLNRVKKLEKAINNAHSDLFKCKPRSTCADEQIYEIAAWLKKTLEE